MTWTVTSRTRRPRDSGASGPGALSVARPWVRYVVVALPLVLGLLVIWLTLALPLPDDSAQQLATLLYALGAAAVGATGAVLIRPRRTPAIAPYLIAAGALGLVGRAVTGLALLAHHNSWPADVAWGWASNWAWVPGQAAVVLLLLRFPDGSTGPFTRLVERGVLGWSAVALIVLALYPGPLGAQPLAPLTNPLGVGQPGPFAEGLLSTVFLLLPLLLCAGAVTVVVRYVRSSGTRRAQLRWPVLAMLVLAVAAPVALLTLSDAALVLEALTYLLLPGSIVLAVLRHQLFDVEVGRRLDRLRAARADERRRLQRELHDGIGPLLGVISLRAEASRNLLRAGGEHERVDDVLASIGADAARAIDEIRRILAELDPGPLDERDLVAALRDEVVGLHPGATVRAHELGELPRPVEIAILRIATEAVHNVARHAAASHCRISLARHADVLVLEVEDDGCGIRSVRAGGGQPSGLGLSSMRQRSTALGGILHIGPREGGGTVVRAEVPVTRGAS